MLLLRLSGSPRYLRVAGHPVTGEGVDVTLTAAVRLYVGLCIIILWRTQESTFDDARARSVYFTLKTDTTTDAGRRRDAADDDDDRSCIVAIYDVTVVYVRYIEL